MKKLLDLQLSIPCIDELTTRKLIGGNGYGIEDDFNSSIMLPEVVITPDEENRNEYYDEVLQDDQNNQGDYEPEVDQEHRNNNSLSTNEGGDGSYDKYSMLLTQ